MLSSTQFTGLKPEFDVNHLPRMAMATPAPILLILAAKRDFVSSMLAAGKTPTPQQLASFLQALVVELLPHVKSASPHVGEALKTGLSVLGWSAQANAPLPGSAPPQPDGSVRERGRLGRSRRRIPGFRP